MAIHVPVGLAARTTSGNSQALALTRGKDLMAYLRVSAASGTAPTLDVVVEELIDGTNYVTIGTFAQKGAAGSEAISLRRGRLGTPVRVRWTVGGGTPNFTFEVILGEAGGDAAGAANVVVALAARTGAGNQVFTLSPAHDLRAYLRATAAVALDVFVEEQFNGTDWIALATFATLGAAGRQAIAIPAGRTGRPLRVRWAGTSGTFEVKIAQGA